MVNRIASRVALLLSLSLVLVAGPVMAQGKGNGNGNGNGNGRARQAETARPVQERRPELERRTTDEDARYMDLYGNVYSGTTGRRQGVPPGWCQGRGNPHNTVANCGYTNARRSGTYDGSRSGDYYEGSRSGDYYQQHQEFHRYLDQKYSSLAAQRPLDIRYQIELRSQKSAEHNRWHAQMGTRHE